MKNLSRIALAIIIAGIAISAALPALAKPYQPAPTNPGTTNLTACWDHNETSGVRYDWSANDRDLTDYNTVGYGTGKSSNAADFESGNAEALYIASNSVFEVANASFYLGAWVNLESTPSYATIAAKYHNSTAASQAWALIVNSGTPKLFTEGNAILAWGSTLSTGTWYYVEYWYDATGDKQYLNVNNGTPVSISDNDGLITTTTEFDLGAFGTHQNGYFDGLMDTVVMYKNDFPDANEREWLYNSGSGRSCADLDQATATPTYTPSSTFTPSDTATRTATPTDTPEYTATFTPTPSDTATPTRTYTPTATATDTATATPTSTNTDGPSPTPSNTPTITDTPTVTNTPLPGDAMTATTEYYSNQARTGFPVSLAFSGLCLILILGGIVSFVIWLNRNRH